MQTTTRPIATTTVTGHVRDFRAVVREALESELKSSWVYPSEQELLTLLDTPQLRGSFQIIRANNQDYYNSQLASGSTYYISERMSVNEDRRRVRLIVLDEHYVTIQNRNDSSQLRGRVTCATPDYCYVFVLGLNQFHIFDRQLRSNAPSSEAEELTITSGLSDVQPVYLMEDGYPAQYKTLQELQASRQIRL